MTPPNTSSRIIGVLPRGICPLRASWLGVDHHTTANASLTLAGAGSANEQLAAPVRSKLATTEEGPSGSFRGALS